MRNPILSLILIFFTLTVKSQTTEVLTFTEYFAYVKKYHPIVKQANLLINESEAKLLKARGSFDPKFALDYDGKQFKQTEYYNKLNAAFKIPTWYGVSFKGGIDDNTGDYLNPEGSLPNVGLYSLGVSVSLAKGLLINERMATLKKAKIYQKQAEVDNQLLVNEILYNAALAYFNWLKTYREKIVYEEFLNNADLRLQGVIRSFNLGEKPAIDTTEARIALFNRRLNLEKAKLNYIKATLQLSNYLWIADVPVEVKDNILPDLQINNYINDALLFNLFEINDDFSNHPKLQSLQFKSEGLAIDKRLQKNNLLPQIDFQYNLLAETSETFNSLNANQYKAGVAISMPIFLRKERAELKLTDYKLQAIDFEREATSLTLKNKLSTVQQEIDSYNNQIAIADNIVTDYTLLLNGEKRLFEIGESSLFLINTRESKLIENKLKAIELENLLLKAKGKLYNVSGL